MRDVAKLAAAWCTWTPPRLRRWSPLLSAAWADGLYLTAWPRAAVLLPMLALLVGFREGVTHWSFYTLWDGGTNPRVAVTFVQMLPLLYVAAIAGAFSAQLGLLLVVGFAAGDWFLADPAFQYPSLSGLGHFVQIDLTQLISYGLFFLLAVQPTITARLLAGSLGRPARPSGVVWFLLTAVVAAALQGVIVYAWTLSAPMVIRPIWMWAWHGEWPQLTIPYFAGILGWVNPPVSGLNPWLPAAATVAALVRAGLTFRARRSEVVRRYASGLAVAIAEADRQTAFTRRVPAWLKAIISALAVTLLLGGFLASLWLGIEVFVVIAAILIIRAVALPRVPVWNAWTALVGRMPFLIRWLLALGAGYATAHLVYLSPNAAVQANQQAGQFGPELVSIILGLIVTTLLLSGGQSGTATRSSRLQLGPGTARAVAVALLLVGLVRAKPALAWCADSFCCFGTDNQATLAIAALLLMLSLFFLPEELAFIGVTDLAEWIGVQVERAGIRGALNEIASLSKETKDILQPNGESVGSNYKSAGSEVRTVSPSDFD